MMSMTPEQMMGLMKEIADLRNQRDMVMDEVNKLRMELKNREEADGS